MFFRATTMVFLMFLVAVVSPPSKGQQAEAKTGSKTKPGPLTGLPTNLMEAEITSAHGGVFKLAQYNENVIVVHLWATWCAPCRDEAPVFVRLDEKFRNQSVQIVELTTENRDASMEDVQAWIRNYGIRHQVGWAPSELATALIQGYMAIPQTFVISSSGRVLKRFIGFDRRKTPLLFEKAIEEALVEGNNINK